jgi:glutamate-1-semialdehyde aminotransferase
MSKGHSFSLPTPLEEEVAELICDIVPSAEMVRFGKAGHEATMAAVRLARGYHMGSRDRILVVKPSYHGCGDWYQSLFTDYPSKLDNGIPYPTYGRLVQWVDKNQLCKHWPQDAAAVIMEPVTVADPELPRTGWLQNVREWCDQHGALLIFDEIVTFGRFPKLTAQEYFSVTPDLTCLGKCMGNGLPLSAILFYYVRR